MPHHLRNLVLLVAALAPALALAEPPQARFERERSRAERALRSLERGRTLSVSWSALHARPVALRGLEEASDGEAPAERARRFLARHPDLFPAADVPQLAVIDVQAAGGWSFVRFQQQHQGITVEGGLLVVALDPRGKIRSVSSEAASVQLASVRPALDATSAARAAVLQSGLPLPAKAARASWARLVILPQGTGRLVYRVMLPYSADTSGRVHFIDAMTGAYLGPRPGAIIDRVGVLP